MVIQRWQSLFLLISAVFMSCFSFLSLGQVQLTDATLNFTAFGFFYEGQSAAVAPEHCALSTIGLFVVSIISAVLALIAIFSFKNLKAQLRLVLIDVLFIMVTIFLGAWYGYSGFEGGEIYWSSMVCAPFIALIANVMAYNRISADARLLRDSERLR